MDATAEFGADSPCLKLRSVGEIVSESLRRDDAASFKRDSPGLWWRPANPGWWCIGGGEPDEEFTDPADDDFAPTIESMEKPNLLDLWLPAATDVGCKIDMVSAARVIASDVSSSWGRYCEILFSCRLIFWFYKNLFKMMRHLEVRSTCLEMRQQKLVSMHKLYFNVSCVLLFK